MHTLITTHPVTTLVVVLTTVVLLTLVDIVRHPQWAWAKIEEHRSGYAVLTVALPLVGTLIYLRLARPRLHRLLTAGRAASLPFEQFGVNMGLAGSQADFFLEQATHSPLPEAARRGSFAEVMDPTPATTDGSQPLPGFGPDPVPVIVASDESTQRRGQTLTRIGQESDAETWVPSLYRHNVRRGLQLPTALADGTPQGWEFDPTGRHQYRYWDGASWTSHVADGGAQTQDLIA